MAVLQTLYKHKCPIDVRFADIDAMGHVNNAKYLTYIEHARAKYLSSAIQVPIDWKKHGVILGRVEHDFLLPVYYGENIFVYTRCKSIGNKSLVLEYLLVKEVEGQEVEIGKSISILVAYDYENGHSMQVPDAWRTSLLAFEAPHSLA